MLNKMEKLLYMKTQGAQKGELISSHLPQRLFVGFFDALPLGDGAMGDDGRDSGLVGACETQHHRNTSVSQSLSIKLDPASPMPPCH